MIKGSDYAILKRRKTSQSILSAIFQTVITLTLGFLVIAALRTPLLTQESLERAQLVEQIHRLSGELQENRGMLGQLLGIIGGQGLSRQQAIAWLSQTADRLRRSELNGVRDINREMAEKKQWLPTEAEIRGLAGLTKKQSQTDMQQWQSRLEQGMNSYVAAVTDAPGGRLFPETKEAVGRKAAIFLQEALEENFNKIVKTTTQEYKQHLDWADLKWQPIPLGDDQILAARADAYQDFKALILKVIPQPESTLLVDNAAFLEQRIALVEELTKKAFLEKCRQLDQEDAKLAAGLNNCRELKVLARADLFSSDSGGARIQETLESTAGLPKNPDQRGPAVKDALQNVREIIYTADLKRLQTEISSDCKRLTWQELIRKNPIPVEYDDYWVHGKTAKTERISKIIKACLQLEQGIISDQTLRREVEQEVEQRAAELLDIQIGLVHKQIERQISQYAGDLPKQIADRQEGLPRQISQALLEDDGLNKAIGLVTNNFKKEYGITQFLEKHAQILQERSGLIVREGYARLIEENIPSLDVELPITLRHRMDPKLKEDWITQRIEQRKQIAPLQVLNNREEFIKQLRKQAEIDFDEHIQQAEARFHERKLLISQQQVDTLTPEDWEKFASEEQLVEAVMDRILEACLPDRSNPDKAGGNQ